MMGTISFSLAVRIAAAAYLLYKVWRLLFGDRLFGLWDRIPVKGRKPAAKAAKPVNERAAGTSVLGRTNIVLLDDPRGAAPVPVASADLEPTGFIGRQEPIPADDLDTPVPPHLPAEDELYGDTPPPDDEGMSSGVSFQELSEAAQVLAAGTRDEARRAKAAKTLYEVRDTEILDFIVREVCGAEAVDSLFRECLDTDGFPLKRRAAPVGFDIRDYV